MITKMDFSEKIKSIRLAKNISGNAVAKIIGISQPYLWEIEKGKRFPSMRIMKRICAVFNIDPETLESLE